VGDKPYRDVTAQGFYGIRPTNSKWYDSAVFVRVPRLFVLRSNLLILKDHDGKDARICLWHNIHKFIHLLLFNKLLYTTLPHVSRLCCSQVRSDSADFFSNVWLSQGQKEGTAELSEHRHLHVTPR